jgi:glucose/arabinose dehydrogenase
MSLVFSDDFETNDFSNWSGESPTSELSTQTGAALEGTYGLQIEGAGTWTAGENGQTLVRVAFDQPLPQSERRDSLFMSLGRRWRHVVQSPDGYLYALTEKRTLGGTPDADDATSGVVYRIEPAD